MHHWRIAQHPGALVVCVALLVAVVAERVCRAEKSGDDAARAAEESHRPAKRGRSVGGHNFAEFRTVVWPFVSTRVTSVTALGLAEFTQSPRALDVEFKGKFSTFREEFLLGLAPTRWLGFELFFEGGILGGIDRPGSLIIGFNTGATGGGAIALRLFEAERFYLSARALGKVTHFEGIAPVRVLDALELDEDGDISIESLESIPLSSFEPSFDGEVFTGAGELASAFGFGRLLGVQASVRLGWRKIDSSPTETESEGSVECGLGLSLDLSSSGLAAQLLAGGRVAWDFGDDQSDIMLSSVLPSEELRVEPEVGLFYSGRPNLELGLAVVGLISDNDKRGEASVRLGYFW